MNPVRVNRNRAGSPRKVTKAQWAGVRRAIMATHRPTRFSLDEPLPRLNDQELLKNLALLCHGNPRAKSAAEVFRNALIATEGEAAANARIRQSAELSALLNGDDGLDDEITVADPGIATMSVVARTRAWANARAITPQQIAEGVKALTAHR